MVNKCEFCGEDGTVKAVDVAFAGQHPVKGRLCSYCVIIFHNKLVMLWTLGQATKGKFNNLNLLEG